jgi:hypothetical protein
MSDFKTIIVTVVPQHVTEVRLYDETIEHVREGHPEIPAEFPCITHAVKETIENPSHIEKSYSNSYVFVNDSSTNHSGDPLRVPIKIVEGTLGRVKTFFFATPDYEPEIVWRKGERS